MGPAYCPQIFAKLFEDKIKSAVNNERPTVVFVVCGGSKVSLDDMYSYTAHLGGVAGQTLKVRIDEEHLGVKYSQ